MSRSKGLPLLAHPTDEASVFVPENLLARASAMQGGTVSGIPACCVLDFDGELAPVARERFGARPSSAWACFHTTLLVVQRNGFEMGLIAGTVGAPFAVLVAEQLIASGCRHIVGYSSAGAVDETLGLPCLAVPDRAVRDEGPSYHYLPPAVWVEAAGDLPPVPALRAAGVLSVEMEAAALMALARTRTAEIASLLHVTNSLGTGEDDFHRGPRTSTSGPSRAAETPSRRSWGGRRSGEGRRSRGAGAPGGGGPDPRELSLGRTGRSPQAHTNPSAPLHCFVTDSAQGSTPMLVTLRLRSPGRVGSAAAETDLGRFGDAVPDDISRTPRACRPPRLLASGAGVSSVAEPTQPSLPAAK
jgi:hypothetical protein